MDVTAWTRQPFATAPPYHVEQCGAAFAVCDARGTNIAHTARGAILLWTAEDAEAVRIHLERN